MWPPLTILVANHTAVVESRAMVLLLLLQPLLDDTCKLETYEITFYTLSVETTILHPFP
uniref:Uncharacterized protein n=1 Tax=Arion vulgaris TaxID=1028688 RepID=A0A0B6XYE7_9EUPU